MAPKNSLVTQYPAADPTDAARHFLARLSVETDPSDVHHDLQQGVETFVVVDVRAPEAFAKGHVPGAVSLPHRTISSETTARLPQDKLLVVYAWGPHCNAAQKGAAKLAGLGFRVKEMIGGFQYWQSEGYPVVSG
ncbi:rhodanese-like domain-containing protein [Desulfocurvibacter africanus]|uniref:rhodanese-like domain-containing protein n=1 Tax=Desulfocurvibacter africanus TaxID=873 RepID=UPI0003F594A1|nr:rhodanese-like domain-containing protein [Desulfocurvibacter africanus]